MPTKTNPNPKTLPAPLRRLLATMTEQPANVARASVAFGFEANTVEAGDVDSARRIAEAAITLMANEAKTERDKLLAKSTAACNSLALAIGDLKANRAPSPAALHGYRVLKSGASVAGAAQAALETLFTHAARLGLDVDAEVAASACGVGKRGDYVKGKTSCSPLARVVRGLTGVCAAAGCPITAQARSALWAAAVAGAQAAKTAATGARQAKAA